MQVSEHFLVILMRILAWLGFVGKAIEAGAQLCTLVAGFFRPEFVPRLYGVNDSWAALLPKHPEAFFGIVSLALAHHLTNACAWFFVLRLFLQWKPGQPFGEANTKALNNIALAFLWVGMLGFASANYAGYLRKWYGADTSVFAHSGEYFFLAGLVYLMAKVFAKGDVLNQENQLTV